MSEPRKDIRAKLDPDLHAALCALADAEGVDIAVFVEREVVRAVIEKVRLVTLASTALQRSGLAGRLLGACGNGRD
jgi:hypothetical protein